MADENGEGDFDWSGRGGADEDAFFAMEGLQATLQQLEGRLRQEDISEASSTEYCDNFCEVLMQYAGSRNSVEHGLSLLEVYCLSINCFAAARPHLTGESPSVALVLKRLALSCFELLLSVPQNEIPFEAWLQFHGSVQAAHEAVLQYGSTDLQTLLHITGEGGAWNSPALVALLTRQPTDADEVNDYLALEGEDFLEMRIKHLEKVGEVEKALILTKACGGCSLLPSQASFHQTFVTQLCQLLPSEEAIAEISKLDAKDVLDIICNMETDGDENTAFILCTTFLTQQLQQEDLQCSWELTLIWSKLQRRIDGSLESFMERCLQFGAIAKTVYHLLFLIRVIQTETVHFGLAVSVELCVKAFQLPRQQDVETKTTVCKTVACLLPDDLEVLRACQLTEFLLSPSQEVFDSLEDLYRRPDQKYDEENAIIPNSLRCELLLALKGHWPFDPEFWDWKTLKHYCVKVLGRDPEEEEGPVAELVTTASLNAEEEEAIKAQEEGRPDEGRLAEPNEDERGGEPATASQHKKTLKKAVWTSERARRWQQYKFLCQICQREVIEPRFLHHARKHAVSDVWTCPVCLLKFESRQDFVPHTKKHLRMPARVCHLKKKKVKKKRDVGKNQLELDTDEEEANDLEPGQVPLDPSLVMYYQSSRDPVVLQHILEQAATVPKKQSDDDYITFDYISTHYKLQDREVYHCPATDCSKNFKLFKYLGVHLKNDHDDSDPNVRHYMEMRDRREKCTFCRRTFMSAYHHRRHRRAHYGERPYTCVVAGCGACFATTNQLIEHKHQHGFRLSYHCELRGCSLSFCDLGQLYHHEAQHFRDAAYTCTSPGCRKFYYSRKEFLKHLATHDISFTEKEFEAQRKAKRKLFLPDVGDDVRPEVVRRSDEDLSNEPPQHLEREESKVCLAQVAVCFDGKTFTCGLDKCGRTFTKARDIQKHLKIVHPDQFKEEKQSCKTRDKRLKTRFLKEQRSAGEVSPSVGSLQDRDLLPAVDAASCDATISLNSSTRACKVEICTALSEIVQGFSQLSLTSATATLPRTPRRQEVGARGLCQTPPTAAPPKATPSKIELRSHLSKKLAWKRDSAQDLDMPLGCVPQKGPSVDQMQTERGAVVLHTDRPYVCDVKSCFFESVTSRALVHHYFRKHGYSKKDVGQMEIFNSLKFKPFKCHLCSKVYRERKVLKSHCLHKHNASDIVVENIKFHVKTKVEDTLPSAKQAPLQPKDREGSFSTKMRGAHAENRNKPSWKHRAPNGDHRAKMVKTEDQKLRRCLPPASQQSPCPLRTTRGRRASQRLVRKEIPCLDVGVEDKAYLCVHKGCHAGFMKQWNLLRHLQDVHHYNSSQFYWEEDGNLHPCKHSSCKKKFYQLSSLYKHYRSDHQSSEEPIPRFKCSYGNCNASYHLKSSLLRHTREVHEGEESLEATPLPPPPPPQCNGSYKKPVFYRRGEQTEVRVVRLQSARRRDGSSAGCQKKLLLTSPSPPLKTSERLALKQSSKSHDKGSGASQTVDKFEAVGEAPDEERDVKHEKPKPRKIRGEFVLRTPEEALQMCQDRCMRVAFPCMIQDCESVVSQLRSLRRHYLQCHKMQRTRLAQNEDKLYFTAEQLEELIQQKSAVSAVPELARVPNGVLKMEYQAEPENPGGPPLPMSLHSIKMEPEGQEALEFSGEPHADSAVLIGADDVLYGESNGHAEQITEKESPGQEAHTKGESPAPPLDLSPPSTLRITGSDAPLEFSERESKPASVPPGACTSPSLGPTRQPLRWRNSELSEPLPVPPHPPAQKDVMSPTLAPRAFDLAGYKPSGFESSFLKFIQEKEENHKRDKLCSVGVLNACYKPDAPRRRDCYRRNGSVKENDRRGPTRSRRSRSSLLKPLLSTDECSSIQNLRFILERALTGCGDQAIKQLQFLKPVVVLERPKSSASLLDLLPPETKAEA